MYEIRWKVDQEIFLMKQTKVSINLFSQIYKIDYIKPNPEFFFITFTIMEIFVTRFSIFISICVKFNAIIERAEKERNSVCYELQSISWCI